MFAIKNLAPKATRSVLSRSYITHVPRVASSSTTGTISYHEHAPIETFTGDVSFNEDIAIERFHEKAVATDSMRAAANFEEIRVVPSASSNYQNINILYEH